MSSRFFADNEHAVGRLEPATMLEDAPALSKKKEKRKNLLPPHQGLLFMLLENLPHAVSGNTRDDRGCLKRYSKKKKG